MDSFKLFVLSYVLSLVIDCYKLSNLITTTLSLRSSYYPYPQPSSSSSSLFHLKSNRIGYNTNVLPAFPGGSDTNKKIEKILRSYIVSSNVIEACSILNSLNSSILDTGRNVIYVICETCRRSNQVPLITRLLQAIPHHVFACTEDDVIPLLCEYVEKSNMKPVQPVISYLNARNTVFSAKAFSIMLKGNLS